MLHLHNIMEGIQMLNFVDTHADAIYLWQAVELIASYEITYYYR